MKEPSPRSSRLALTVGLIATLIVGGGGFLLGQNAAERPMPAITPASVTVVPTLEPKVEPAKRVLGRADLLELAAEASDATARGVSMPSKVQETVGKRFTLTLPFGCNGGTTHDSNAAMRFSYDEKAGALRLHVAPISWTASDWWQQNAPANVEAIEGFWIERPWTTDEACPKANPSATAAGPDPVILPGQTLAIGQFIGPDTSKGRRDGQAYTAVIRMAADAVRPEQGFRVRLTGQIAAAPDGNAILCRQSAGVEQRPICIIATTLDEVAIENQTTGAVLATWAPARIGASD